MGCKLFFYDITNSAQDLFSMMMHTIPVHHHLVWFVNVKIFSTLDFPYFDYKYEWKNWTVKSMCRNIWNICSRGKHEALPCFRYSYFLLSDFQLHDRKCVMKTTQTLKFLDDSKCLGFFKEIFKCYWVLTGFSYRSVSKNKHSKSVVLKDQEEYCFSIQLTGKLLLCLNMNHFWWPFFGGNGLSLLVNAKIRFFFLDLIVVRTYCE